MKIAVYGAASNKIDSVYLETVEVFGKEMAKRIYQSNIRKGRCVASSLFFTY